MVASYTGNLRLTLQGTGDNLATWGDVANTGVFQLIEDSITGVNELNVTTGLNITLTTSNGGVDQARKSVLKLTGEPINDISIIIPNVNKVYFVDGSAFTGNYSITIKPGTGTGVAITAGQTAVVYCDGTNVKALYTPPTIPTPDTLLFPGFIQPYAGSASPDTDLWLLAAGQTLDAISDTSLVPLYNAIGITYGGTGIDDFKLPDLRGRTIIGLDNMGGTSADRITAIQADALGGTNGSEKRTPAGTITTTVSGTVAGHTLTVDQIPAHSHTYLSPVGQLTPSPGSGGQGGNSVTSTSSVGGGNSHNHGWSGSASSSFTGTEMSVTQPYIALNYLIKK